MRLAQQRPFAVLDIDAPKLIEIGNDAEAVQDGRIYFERRQRTARAVVRSVERLL
jgi:hypothetical protein